MGKKSIQDLVNSENRLRLKTVDVFFFCFLSSKLSSEKSNEKMFFPNKSDFFL